MEMRASLGMTGNSVPVASHPSDGSRKTSSFAEVRERFAHVALPYAALESGASDGGRAADGDQCQVATVSPSLPNGWKVESQKAADVPELGQLRLDDELLGGLDIVDEIDLWEMPGSSFTRRSSLKSRRSQISKQYQEALCDAIRCKHEALVVELEPTDKPLTVRNRIKRAAAALSIERLVIRRQKDHIVAYLLRSRQAITRGFMV